MADRKTEGERAFIAAILDQAFSDSISRDKAANRMEARRFIDANNKLFRYYCHLLDMEPEYVARKMQERIRQHTFKPLPELRE